MRYLKMFARRGVAERVMLEGELPHEKLLANYQRIDIALDPFPYTGALSTVESLWMGVPVVTLAGETMVGRQSMSHIAAVGLRELIAENREEYLNIAVELARDLPKLSGLRAGLREKMTGTICDARRFTRHLESAMRKIWTSWCTNT
jgi:predicted O-linked N-acetylglucosamine transferase (SPINDLY family)